MSVHTVRNLNILLVDDDPLFQRLIRMNLAVYNQLKAVSSLAYAEQAILEIKPDIVLLDLYLENESGLQFVPTVKSLAPAALIVILTGESDFYSAMNALELGADDYIVKSEHLVADLQIRLPVAIQHSKRLRALETASLAGLPTDKQALSKTAYEEYVGKSKKLYLEKALMFCNGNVTETAEKLGISRATLFNRINDFAIDRRLDFSVPPIRTPVQGGQDTGNPTKPNSHH